MPSPLRPMENLVFVIFLSSSTLVLFPFFLSEIFISFTFYSSVTGAIFQYQRDPRELLPQGALNGCHGLTGCSSITVQLSHGDNILQGKNKMTTVMPAVVYFYWDKTIIFLLCIDLIDFPFSAQDKFSDIFFLTETHRIY